MLNNCVRISLQRRSRKADFIEETIQAARAFAKKLCHAVVTARALATFILCLLREGDYSHFHRIRQDEF